MYPISSRLILSILSVILTVAVAKAPNHYIGYKNELINKPISQESIRLPKSLIPKTYDIEYKSINFKDKTFEGKVKIWINVTEDASKVLFHKGKHLNITVTNFDVKLESPQSRLSGKCLLKNQMYDSYNETTEIVTYELHEPIPAGSRLKIGMNFNGTLLNDMRGFYWSSFLDENGKEQFLATTQFEENHARHAFPCFDEPAFKSKFTIKINPPKDYICLSNMKKTDEGCKFEESVEMSSYLVAFVVAKDFDSKCEKGWHGDMKELEFCVWSRKAAVKQTEYALEIGYKSVNHFAERFGIHYPITKMDMIAIPDFSAGAMENWGLITYRETAVLYDEKDSSDMAKQRVASVIIHEMAHQWFGDLVTPDWWSYMWLSEGFARYFQYFATNEIEDSWEMDKQFVVEQVQTALSFDSSGESLPMSRVINTTAGLKTAGGTITYNKGASVIRMMEHSFGSENFNAALSSYLKKMAYKSAKPEDLWESIQMEIEPTKLKVAELMKTWTEKPGYPYVTVTVTSDKITFVQNRFLFKAEKEAANQTWHIPITLAAYDKNNDVDKPMSTKPVFWLNNKTDWIKNEYKDANFLIFNVKSVGFYRVKYDEETTEKILKVLNSKDYEKIGVLNRAAFIDDTMNLARIGQVSYKTVFRALDYLKREKNYLPFKAAFTALDYLMGKFETSDNETNQLFTSHVTKLISNIYKKLSYEDKEDDDHLTKLLRQEVNRRACKLNIHDCVKNSLTLFSKWKEHDEHTVPKNHRQVVYCTAMRHGNDSDWKYLWKEYEKSNVAAEQVVILGALGCTKNETILEKYLEIALSEYSKSRIHKQDMGFVTSGIYSESQSNAEFLIDSIYYNTDKFINYYKDFDDIESILSGALRRYPTTGIMEKISSIIQKPGLLEPCVKSLNKTMKKVETELQSFKKLSTDIINIIKARDSQMYRLPKTVVPTHYNLKLELFEKIEDFKFHGEVEILATTTSDTDEILLHVDQLQIKSVKVYSIISKEEDMQEQRIETYYDEKHDLMIINLAEVKAKTNLQIRIYYTGTLNREMRGFYRSFYKDGDEIRWLAATHLEPTGARRVFPCFDEPAFKATFRIKVKAPSENYRVVSNMDLDKRYNVSNNMWTFKKSPRMSTYLVAVVVSDFKQVYDKDYDENSTELKLSALAQPSLASQLSYSLEVLRPIVEEFGKSFNHSFDLPKLDLVALPDFNSGAMENWGLITFRETGLLYDPVKMSSIATKQSIRNVIAHEVAHQWFGNLVSPLWWDYLWLNEGFARYFQNHLITRDVESWELPEQFVVDHLQTSMTFDGSTSTHPVTHKVNSPSEIRAIFDKISYAKAGSLIRMLEKITGRDVFYGALTAYLKQRQFTFGTPDKLFDAFKNYSKNNEIDVHKIMKSWTKQSGFPVVKASLVDGKLNLEQSRYYTRPKKLETPEDPKSLWEIPITYATSNNPNFNNFTKLHWFSKKSESLNVELKEDEWIIINLQQAGYYRVNYDKNLWDRIIKALNSNDHERINKLNKANLIDDLFKFGRSGELSYDLVFEAANYLAIETEYVPWKAAFTNLAYLNRRFSGRPEIYNTYREYLLQLLEPNFERLRFEDKDGDKHTDILLRRYVLEWMCTLEDNRCIDETDKLFRAEQKDPKNQLVPPNKQMIVYSTVVRLNKTLDWEYLWKKFKNSNYATEKQTLLNALAHSRNPDKLQMLMKTAITPDSAIRLQDAKHAFTAVVDGGLLGTEIALEFIEKNFDKMKKYTGDDSIAQNTISIISKRLSTPRLVEKFRKFVNDNAKKMESINKTLQTAQKRALFEEDWVNDKASKIFKYMDKRISKKDSYRLPTIVEPTLYDLYIKPYISESKFDGKVAIDVHVKSSTYKIVMNAYDMEIKEIVINNDIEISDYFYNKDLQTLTIIFKKCLEAGKEYRLTITYVGNLRETMRGFYKSQYKDENNNIRWIASTHFEPSYARRAFPCFDEPSFKAAFTVKISRPNNYRTLSNMGSKPRTIKENEDRTLDIYDKSVVIMSPYTLAFVMFDFVNVSNNSRVSTWSRSSLKSYMNESLKIGERSLEFLENFTKIKYPLKEMNFVAMPDFEMGAMENWGLITYREYGLTYDPKSISASYRRYVDTTISHELVHQWFGNLATCHWWDYIWLNEGFADYISYLASNKYRPSWQLLKQFAVLEVQSGLAADSSNTSHAMNNKVLKPNELQDGFDSIAYAKSASVLRMLHHSLGKNVFVGALQDYLKKHQYESVKPEDLLNAISSRAGKIKIPGELSTNVINVMNSWISQPGYPLVHASRANLTVTFSQERFYTSHNNSAKDQTYWVPLTWTTSVERDFNNTEPKLWLSKEKQSIEINDHTDWFIVNVQQIGFYRVNYDRQNWDRLAILLNGQNFTDIEDVNRAQLIDDSLNLARAGYIDYEVALNLTKYLAQETNYLPWKSMISSSAYLSQRIESDDEMKELYKKYVLGLLDKTYEKLGFVEDLEKDSHFDQLTREMILNLACKYGHEKCVEESVRYFKSEKITPNIASAVFCTAMEHGSQDDWRKLWIMYENANLPTDYVTILKSLGCSRDPTILKNYLKIAVDRNSKIRRQDIKSVFTSVYSSSAEGLTTALQFFEENIFKLHDYFDSWPDVGSLLTKMASQVTRKDQLSKLEEINNKFRNTEIKSSLASAIKIAKTNMEWFDKNKDDIRRWLKQNDASALHLSSLLTISVIETNKSHSRQSS